MMAPVFPHQSAVVCCGALIFLNASRAMAETIFVSAAATGDEDGTSWIDAYTHLGDAIEESDEEDEIWIVAGTYLCAFDDDPLNRQTSFVVEQALSLYGGFAGFENERDQRDPIANPTILSGDLLGDDTEGAPMNKSDNSHHVIRVDIDDDEQVRLDGLTIIGGNADNKGDDTEGGAIHITGGSIDVVDCTLQANNAIDFGGAIYCVDADLSLTGCHLNQNQSDQLGGGVYALGCTVTIADSSFFENTSAASGGGIYSTLSSLLFTRTTFLENSAGAGGGIYSFWFSSLDMANCVFTANNAVGSGGGAYVHDTDVRAQNCIFDGNTAVTGAGLYNIELLFYSTTLANCLFVSNTASSTAGGFKNVSGVVNIDNSIFWNNTPEDFLSEGIGEDVTTAYSSFSLPIDGVGNIVGDPLFVDPLGPDGVAGTWDDDLRLSSDSPGIDAGDNGRVLHDFADLDDDSDVLEPSPLDASDLPRFVDDPSTNDTGEGMVPLVDLGPFEYQPSGTACEGDANGDGLVDPLDLGFVAARFGCEVGAGDESCNTSDQNGDGLVDPLDGGFILARLGTCG